MRILKDIYILLRLVANYCIIAMNTTSYSTLPRCLTLPWWVGVSEDDIHFSALRSNTWSNFTANPRAPRSRIANIYNANTAMKGEDDSSCCTLPDFSERHPLNQLTKLQVQVICFSLLYHSHQRTLYAKQLYFDSDEFSDGRPMANTILRTRSCGSECEWPMDTVYPSLIWPGY